MGAILELQREALDERSSLTALLRKALVVARKLHLAEFEAWVSGELRGYDPEKDEVPRYREVAGQVKAWNPYHGWVTVMFGSDAQANLLSHRKCSQSVAELEELVGGSKSASQLYMPFAPGMQSLLRKATRTPAEFAFFTSRTEMVKILSAARTIVLNWSLKLEEEGVSGEGLLFSDQEKARAKEAPQNITNFFGPVQNPTLQQGAGSVANVSIGMDAAGLKDLMTTITDRLDEFGLGDSDRRQVAAEVRTVQAQLEAPKPKWAMVRESAEGIKGLLANIHGAAEIVVAIGRLLS